MFKQFFLSINQKKINSLNPKVNIFLNKEMPTPSFSEAADFSRLASVVNSFEKELSDKPDGFFKEKTLEFRKLISDKTAGIEEKEYKDAVNTTLDEILPYYFAMVREAARRTVKMRHFDVQVLGGVVLHNSKISEMVTGEGKTLVATLSVSLNALTARGVHVVTVNDYLARRDREWMGPIYEFLGFSVGVIQQDMDKEERRLAYNCDITYGTNNEFGFDYLRDNMVTSLDEMVQRGHFYAVVDEVDSILIDEARTPLIISGPSELSTQKYYMADKAVRQLTVKNVIQSFETKEGTINIKNTDGSETVVMPQELEEKYDAIVEEKSGYAYLTSRGEKKCEQILSVSSVSDEMPDRLSNPWVHYINQALRAHSQFRNDREYIVKDGKVIIVDEFTGRLMPGRRWSDGLHQAVEAKEGLRIQEESQTLATITLQNYFRMYTKLAGMTGTAYTEANEFRHIYNLDVTVIPTNKKLERLNQPDRIYKTKRGKFNAVVEEIGENYNSKRPVLVGTTSIEDSEELSFMLNKKGVPHNVLNAKYHEKEAMIVSQAGRLGQITIATNMAGRGTDIILGGNLDYFIKDILRQNKIDAGEAAYRDEYEKLYQKHKPRFDEEHDKVVSLGGLYVIGTQRHEARRIDNQLRGRCGRQGDTGASRFYVSLEDDLMRLFGSERINFLMEKFNFPEDQPLEHQLISYSLETAQKRVEGHNFEIRKQLLDYDNVMNKQREVIYKQRREILEKESIKEDIMNIIDEVINANIGFCLGEEKNIHTLSHWLKSKFDWEINAQAFADASPEEISELVKKSLKELYQKREDAAGSLNMRSMEKMVALWVVDMRWKENLLIMDSLREGIHLRGYAQTDPLVEYQREAYDAFDNMVLSIKEGIIEMLFKTRIEAPKEKVSVMQESPKTFTHSEYSSLSNTVAEQKAPQQRPAANKPVHADKKVGRNEPCPCGSGKKYKKCCGG